MVSGPSYIIIGKGRWGLRMHALLAGEGRRVNFATHARREPGERDADYEARVSKSLAHSAAQIAWLCVPPGPHVPPLMRAAISTGLHVIVEKPWVYSREEATALQQAGAKQGLKIGVHFEYCFLSEVENWRREYEQRAGLEFSGVFTTSASDHMGVPAMQNLGSHLFSINAHAVPDAAVGKIACGYESANQRVVWLESAKQRIASIDLLAHNEPIIQRYLTRFESSLEEAAFPIDLQFAQRVKENMEAHLG